MPIHSQAPSPGAAPSLFLHGLLIPAAFLLAAFAASRAGFDEAISTAFFDPATRAFPARAWAAIDLLGYRFAKSAVVTLWFTLLAIALSARFLNLRAFPRRLLWATVAAMAAGPMIVVALKGLNGYHCPWDLKSFGGYADYAAGWFVPKTDAGRCFPGGHAAGGFSLVAVSFAGMAAGMERLRVAGLVAAMVAGAMFSLVRIAQGAHFLSHNLWSAAIVWCAAALVFAVAFRADPRTGLITSGSRP